MVLTMNSDESIESVSRRDHNNFIVKEIEKHAISKNPLYDKVEHRGNISAASRSADMDRKYLHKLAKKHGIERSDNDMKD